jgi:hypothetical protein
MTAHVGSTVLAAAAVWRVSDGSRTVRRNVAAAEAAAGVAHAAAGRMAAATAAACATAATASALGKGGMRNDQYDDERSKKVLHCSSVTCDGKGNARWNREIVDC